MTLPSSGVITLNQIAVEFGGTLPASLSQYYRGGARVPNTAQNAGIPTSGPISLNNFYGAAASAPGVSGAVTIGAAISSGGYFGYSGSATTAASSAFGSASPTVLNGYTILQVFTVYFSSSSQFYFYITISNASDLQTLFTKVTFTDLNGTARSFTSASATFSPGGAGQAYSVWYWTNSGQLFLSGSNYTITFS